MRDELEEGFTLIELLVVILIIGILAAIAIPAFLNQRKSANDGVTKSDVKNAATEVETCIIGQKGVKAPVPDKDTLNIKTSEGVTLTVSGFSDGYCILGTHANGDVASTEGYVYASNDGGMSTKGKSCLNGSLTDEEVVIPPSGETPPASENNALVKTVTGTLGDGNGSNIPSTGSVSYSYKVTRSSAGGNQYTISDVKVSGSATSGELMVKIGNPADPMDDNMEAGGAFITITNGTGADQSGIWGPSSTDFVSSVDMFTASNGTQYSFSG